MKKNKNKVWHIKTNFTFITSEKEEVKLLNKFVMSRTNKNTISFDKDFDLSNLSNDEIISFFKTIIAPTFHSCKITDCGEAIQTTQGWVGNKQTFNKETQTWEIPYSNANEIRKQEERLTQKFGFVPKR